MSIEPTEVQIIEQLGRILESDRFEKSPRKQKFLRFIVEKTLNGEKDQLKGYTIGLDVFDRADSFNPQQDTIVRVQAGNLRKTLDLYYLTDGQSDPIRIDIPKGKYIPRFAWTEPQEPIAEAASVLIPQDGNAEISPSAAITGELKPKSRLRWGNRSIASALFIVFMGGLLWLTISVWSGNGKIDNGFDYAAQMPMGPSLAILPFDLIGNSADEAEMQRMASLKTGLHYELIHKISRFKNIFVIDLKTGSRNSPDRATEMPATQYVLSGSIQDSNGQLRITSILSRPSNGKILWSQVYDKQINSSATLLAIQSSIATDVATSLGQSDSQIHSRFRAEQSKMANIHLDHYYCLMRYYEYSNRKSEKNHREIRDCLEEATTAMPTFSSGWAALTWMYADEEFNRFNPRVGDAPPLERALVVARRGVQADPENAMAHYHLAMARFWTGDDAGFLTSAEIALNLNPNDALILAHIGNGLIRIDRFAQGKVLVEKAMRLNPSHTSWFHSALVIYYYSRNDPKNALSNARIFLQNDSFSAHALFVIALVQDAQIAEAKTAYRNMIEKYPFFPAQYESILKARRLPSGFYQQAVDDFMIAGLAPVI